MNVANLHVIEDQLGGPEPFRGLLAPRWADAVKLAGFPELDNVLVAKGRGAYEKKCLNCHGPSVNELKQDLASDAPKYPQFWVTVKAPPPFNRKFLNPPLSDLARIGTDPAQAAGFASRFAQVPDPFPVDSASVGPTPVQSTDPGLGQPPFTTPSKNMITLSATSGLRVLTENIREQAYARANLTPEQRRLGSLPGRQADARRQGHHHREPEVQGPPARRRLGDAALPAQRVGAHPRRAALARVPASRDVPGRHHRV